MTGENAKENVKEEISTVESILDEDVIKCTFPLADDAGKEALLNEQKNNELLKQNPTEYLIGLLNSLNKSGEQITDDEKKIAETVIKDTIGENTSMKELLEMDINKKGSLLWKLTAIKKYIPREYGDTMYQSITDGLHEGKKIKELRLTYKGGSKKLATKRDLEKYFDKAQAFQIKNMGKLFRKIFPFGEDKLPAMPYDSLIGDIDGNSSISKDFPNVGREYFKYDLSKFENKELDS